MSPQSKEVVIKVLLLGMCGFIVWGVLNLFLNEYVYIQSLVAFWVGVVVTELIHSEEK